MCWFLPGCGLFGLLSAPSQSHVNIIHSETEYQRQWMVVRYFADSLIGLILLQQKVQPCQRGSYIRIHHRIWHMILCAWYMPTEWRPLVYKHVNSSIYIRIITGCLDYMCIAQLLISLKESGPGKVFNHFLFFVQLTSFVTRGRHSTVWLQEQLNWLDQ